MSGIEHWSREGATAARSVRPRHPRPPGHARGRRRVEAFRPGAILRSFSSPSSSDEDGFTLVELLVVVLVLATLVGIAVPTFAQQRESAWDAAVSSELRTAMIALESYRSQNAGYDAAVLSPGSDASASGWGYEPSSDVQLRYAMGLDTYCLIAWFDPDSDVSSPAAASGSIAAPYGKLWGVRSSGAVGPVDADFCGS